MMKVNHSSMQSDWAQQLSQNTRIQIKQFLDPDCAQTLYQQISEIKKWDFAITTPAGPATVPHNELATLKPAIHGRMMEDLRRQARKGFSFAYYRRDVTPGEDRVLDAYAQWIKSPDFFELVRTMTGDAELKYADAQATMYQTGSFLRAHDDTFTRDDGDQRRFAYVLNLTPKWVADWGGLLNFQDKQGRVIDCLFPEFNSLSVFQVPQSHFVSQVASYAVKQRIAITGWLFA